MYNYSLEGKMPQGLFIEITEKMPDGFCSRFDARNSSGTFFFENEAGEIDDGAVESFEKKVSAMLDGEVLIACETDESNHDCWFLLDREGSSMVDEDEITACVEKAANEAAAARAEELSGAEARHGALDVSGSGWQWWGLEGEMTAEEFGRLTASCKKQRGEDVFDEFETVCHADGKICMHADDPDVDTEMVEKEAVKALRDSGSSSVLFIQARGEDNRYAYYTLDRLGVNEIDDEAAVRGLVEEKAEGRMTELERHASQDMASNTSP